MTIFHETNANENDDQDRSAQARDRSQAGQGRRYYQSRSAREDCRSGQGSA